MDDKQKKAEKVEAVISNPAKQIKKKGISKLTNVFIKEDIRSVKSYVVNKVIIPKCRELIIDVVCKGARLLFSGEAESGSKPVTASSERTSYNGYYNSNKRETKYTESRSRYNDGNLLFTSYQDAETVYRSMLETTKKYSIISVATFYELANARSDNFMNHDFGWTDMDIRGRKIVRSEDGYLIDLPNPLPLDD